MRLLLAALTLFAASCREDRPPTPTDEESAQLNEMESALNDMAANEEGPEANATGPSNSSER